MSEIILASGSFLRRFIMDTSRLSYKVMPADIDESVFDHLPVEERVVELAKAKCKIIIEQNPDAIVIAADTLTANEAGQVFSKKTHEQDPFRHALALSGQTIHSVTGCAFYHPSHEESTLTRTQIIYSKFSEENLRRLADKDNPNIRSGALGMFHDAPGFTLIEHIEGSYTGAMGLPMEFVYRQLEAIGYFKNTQNT